MTVAFAEEAALLAAAHRLRARFPELPSDVVDDALAEARGHFDGRPIRDFIPILVERAAAQTLRSTAPTRLSQRIATPAAV